MNNLKTFENYINELDPYGEEIWKDGKMAICLLMTECKWGKNPNEAGQFRNVYAITSDDYGDDISSVLINRIPKARRSAEETIFIKLENYLHDKLGEILHPRKTGTSLVGLVDFMKNKGYKFDEKLENEITIYKTYFYNKEEVDEYIEDAREFADNQKNKI